MFKYLVLLLVSSDIASALSFDFYSPTSQYSPSPGGFKKTTFSRGSPLRLIAQGSAEQAHNAASNQHTAARQAAFIAKSSLAKSASDAAARAQTALTGKQILRQTLEDQLHDAHEQLLAEIQQLQQAEKAARAAEGAYYKAQEQVNTLTNALNSAQGTAVHAHEALTEARQEAASQAAMVSKAKRELSSIAQELGAVNADYQATKNAAQKAEAAARKAHSNAAHSASIVSSDNKFYGFDVSDTSVFDVFVH